MSVQNEIKTLEDKLLEVDGWEQRVKELEGLLGVQEGVEENEEDIFESVSEDGVFVGVNKSVSPGKEA